MDAPAVVSNCCLSPYSNSAGLRQGPGKMHLGSWKVLEFFIPKRVGTLDECDQSSVYYCCFYCHLRREGRRKWKAKRGNAVEVLSG